MLQAVEGHGNDADEERDPEKAAHGPAERGAKAAAALPGRRGQVVFIHGGFRAMILRGNGSVGLVRGPGKRASMMPTTRYAMGVPGRTGGAPCADLHLYSRCFWHR